MKYVVNYQLSTFGKYSVVPTPDTISKLMNAINQNTNKMFLPNIISSQQIELPSNKITLLSNLGFFTQDQQYSIAILNERIDVNYNRINDSNVAFEDFFATACHALSTILGQSIALSNRLAMNIHCVAEMKDAASVRMLGRRLVKSAPFYDDKELHEWSVRTNSQIPIQIGEVQEFINAITDISSPQDNSTSANSVIYHVDINTLPQNQSLRFKNEDLESFIHEASMVAHMILEGVESIINE